MTVDAPFFAVAFSLLAGLLSLDNTALLQMMISQPLVACPLLGWLFGQPAAGVMMGAAFQLLFASDLPVGAYMPKKAPLMSMCALGAGLVFQRQTHRLGHDILAVAAVLAVVSEPLFGETGRVVRRVNNRWAPLVRARLERGHYRRALILAQGGLVVFFLKGFLVTLVFSLGGGLLLKLVAPRLPATVLDAAHWTFTAFPLIGAAHFLSRLDFNRLLDRCVSAAESLAARRIS